MVNGNAFVEIAAILGLATLTGIVGQKLRQPLIIMFLATGILAGPSFLGIIQSYEQIELLAHIGIALLLFIVGLKLDLNLIRTTGPVALATGLGQIVFTSIIGFAIAIVMGMSYLSAAYVSVALTFSSTIIIVKLLSDKKEIDSLHGQIALGFLIVQDIAAILALVALTTLGSSVGGEGSGYLLFLMIGAKGVGLLGGVALLMKYVIPYLTQRLAHSLELLTLFAIAWAVLLGAGSELLGFSKEVGAFLAGVSLASTAFRDSIGARLTGLRDFLLLFFFIDLGARLDLSMAVQPYLQRDTMMNDFHEMPSTTLLLVVVGEDDTIAGDASAQVIFQTADRIPSSQKDYIIQVTDRYGYPDLVADHVAPLCAPDTGTIDALDYYSIWKLFDGLTDYAFYGINWQYALGNTPEQRYMGVWSDGTPVNEMVVID